MVLMLLQSLTPKQGLCNGIRFFLNTATNIVLYCIMASVDYAREEVLISGIAIKHQDEQFIEWNWRHFPVRSAFALIINSSQGQTLRKCKSG